MKCIPVVNKAKNLRLWTQGEAYYYYMLNEHNSTMTCKDMTLYPESNVLLSPQHRSFFM